MKLPYFIILQEIKAWKSWDYKEKDGSTQVAGFVRQFENLTFLTVKVSPNAIVQTKISKLMILRSLSKQNCLEINFTH